MLYSVWEISQSEQLLHETFLEKMPLRGFWGPPKKYTFLFFNFSLAKFDEDLAEIFKVKDKA